ncbi:hypothetical protein JHK82_032321 [Glycine max]|nr:hypothetical protein JHK86_032419 [Glycine max]KAG5125584.1 hypothetical protein JHK82_032321 [Glycine max]
MTVGEEIGGEVAIELKLAKRFTYHARKVEGKQGAVVCPKTGTHACMAKLITTCTRSHRSRAAYIANALSNILCSLVSFKFFSQALFSHSTIASTQRYRHFRAPFDFVRKLLGVGFIFR